MNDEWLSYRFMAATLNDTGNPDGQTPGHQNRYLTLHHLQIRPVKNLYVGVGETILYGGIEYGAHPRGLEKIDQSARENQVVLTAAAAA